MLLKLRVFVPCSLQLLACTLLSSCAFNGLYLHPQKIPVQLNTVTINRTITGDTLLLHLGPHYQPSFTDLRNKPMSMNFSVESVIYSGRSHDDLCGWLFKPDKNPNGITLLFFHGNAGNVITAFPAATVFVKHGFTVFVADYSGFGFSKGKPTRDHVIQDQQAALDLVLSRPDLRQEKIVIYGQSLGGHAAYVLAARNQDKITALVSEGAFSSHKDIAAARSGIFGWFARIAVAEKYSALKSVHRFHKPLLIVHSTEDQTVPYYMGQKLYKRANEPKTLYSIKHPHVYAPFWYGDELSSRIVEMSGGGEGSK